MLYIRRIERSFTQIHRIHFIKCNMQRSVLCVRVGHGMDVCRAWMDMNEQV